MLRFVWCAMFYLREQGATIVKTDTIIIGMKDSETGVVYPHPITDFLQKKYHFKSDSVNSERTAAVNVVPFLNFVLDKHASGHPSFTGVQGLSDLAVHHAELYLETCTEERGNKRSTLETKEYYITSLFEFLWEQGVLLHCPPFRAYTHMVGDKVYTTRTLTYVYKRPNDVFERQAVKRKDFTPQVDQTSDSRQLVRLKMIREFLHVAAEIVPEIALGISLQCFGGLRVGEVVNLTDSALIPQSGSSYGELGLIVEVRDRQGELFERLRSRAGVQVKRERDQSILIDPIVPFLYEKHINKILRSKGRFGGALFRDRYGNAMTSASYYKRFSQLKSYYLGLLRSTPGRLQEYKDLADTIWSTHICRGTFTNMLLDSGFSATQTAILRGDRSTDAMDAYRDLISATFNISRALQLLVPTQTGN